MADATVSPPHFSPQTPAPDHHRAVVKINGASCTLRTLYELARHCEDAIDASTFTIAAMVMTRDACWELDGALVELGETRNGFFDND